MILPFLPAREQIAERARETGMREGVEPELVEKDFYLTRLLWALADSLGAKLLLKGGTLLSKVDLGYFRMSEDADYVLPRNPSREKRENAKAMKIVSDALIARSAEIGVTVPFPAGESSAKASHVVWEIRYDSDFGAQRIRLEVTMRSLVREPRRAKLGHLLSDPELGSYDDAFVWALDADEARAEKVRAAFTREAIRDFYDLDRLADARADLDSPAFLDLVNAKLAEIGAPPLRSDFALDATRRKALAESQRVELPSVLRRDAPAFDLDAMLARFDRMWGKR